MPRAWDGQPDDRGHPADLHSAFLRLASERGLKTIAFRRWDGNCGISDEGLRGDHAATGPEHLRNGSSLERIYFVLFDEQAAGIFERTWKRLQRNYSPALSMFSRWFGAENGHFIPSRRYPSPGFSQVFILKVVKVLCFDTLCNCSF